MLKVAKLERSQDRLQILEDFNPNTDRWIVSDLRSKLEIQKSLLRRFSGLAGDPVLRSSELWGSIFQRSFPDREILQDEWFALFARQLLEGNLERNRIGSAVDLMHVFVPIFLHPERKEILADVLSQDASSMGRWGELLTWSIQIFQAAMEQKWVSRSWIPAVLSSEGLPDLKDKRRYIFDLGASLSASEADLIAQLAKQQEVLVLLPRPDKLWQRFDYLLQPGEQLASSAGESGTFKLEPSSQVASRQDFLRFSGRVAEIKDAVAQVRIWLDQQVPIENIAIITPSFEMDFPVLEEHFRIEGVPLDRVSSRRVQTHRSLQKWTAKLRLWQKDFKYRDLLSSFQDGTRLRSEKFEALFKKSAFKSDLARSSEIREASEGFLKETEQTDKLSLPDFFRHALQLWEENEYQDLERIFESVSEATPGSANLSFGDWVEWTELQLSRLEVSPISEAGEKLAITALQNADSMAWTHRIFLSLVDQLPEKRGLALLTGDEVLRLGWTHGFFLPHPEQTLLQFELEWLLGEGRGTTKNPGHDVFCFPVTDWQGKPTAPQPFVLQGLGDDHSVKAPKLTRWDELQRALDAPKMAEDQALPWAENLDLSVSSVSNYLKCPFIFKAEKVFALKDPAMVDLELDPRSKGSLVHELFDKLLEAPINWNRSLDEIASILDELREKATDFFLDQGLWAPLRKKWALMGFRFLQKEREWMNEYPKLKVLGREQAFKVSYDPKTKSWRAGDRISSGEILFRGKIDRIDGVDGGGVLLYDYKSTVRPEHSFNKWLIEDELQMAFYSWLAEEGFVDPEWKGRVQGGIYYSLKELERKAGFQHPDGVQTLFGEVRPKKFSDEGLDEVWQETRKRIENSAERIAAGDFAPNPVDIKVCRGCRWRGLCRAPHLMT